MSYPHSHGWDFTEVCGLLPAGCMPWALLRSSSDAMLVFLFSFLFASRFSSSFLSFCLPIFYLLFGRLATEIGWRLWASLVFGRGLGSSLILLSSLPSYLFGFLLSFSFSSFFFFCLLRSVGLQDLTNPQHTTRRMSIGEEVVTAGEQMSPGSEDWWLAEVLN